MIAKHVPMRTLAKSNYSDLVMYITEAQGKRERVGAVTVTNCHTDRPDVAITEVMNTQAQNKRSEADKTYHLLVSFRAGEQPTDAVLKAIETRICVGLGFGEHQRVSAVHHDTDNLHIHIAINKIHPTRYTTHEPYYPHKELAKLCDILEREFGLEADNHKANKLGSQNRADDMERHAGVESLLGWIKRECQDQIQEAQSWLELHKVMQANGLLIHQRANGLVITADDGTSVKASSIGRNFSKNSLEARYGAFEPSPERQAPPRKAYAKKPMASRVNTAELHAEYKNNQAIISASRTDEWARAIDRKNRLIEAAKRSGRLKRSAIKLIQGAGLGKRMMYLATSKTLKSEITKINKQYQMERQAIQSKYKRRAWADWLREKATGGDNEALGALRAREAAQGLQGNTMTGSGRKTPAQSHAEMDGITKKGTIIFRAGLVAVRDDGNKLNVSRGATQDGLKVALRMAIERYGERVAVNGTAAFKDQVARAAAAAKLPISFDDAALERRHQELLQFITQEKMNERARTDRGRADRGSNGGSGHATTPDNPTAYAETGRAGYDTPGVRYPGKPNVSRIGRKPPPQGQNRLRGLPELGMVFFASRSEMLLQGDVPGHLEQQGAKPDNRVRRSISGAGPVTSELAAADKYIAEREEKRLIVFDIPKHTRYNYGKAGTVAFAGLRQIAGQTLALLKCADDVMVLPVDDATARRLKRVTVGEVLTVTPEGVINTKGRSR